MAHTNRWFILAVALLLLGSGWGVWQAAQTIGQYADVPPDFDEAVHLLPVRQLAYDLQHGHLTAFGQHTLNQDQLAGYPFFHAWLTVPAWLIAPTITTVRVMSTVYLAAAALVAFALGYDLMANDNGRFRWLAGFVSGLLVLASFPLWIYAGLAYLEGAGLFVSLLALWLYGRSYQEDLAGARRYALLSSFAAALTFFTKYNFGLFLLGGMALNEGIAFLTARPSSRHIPRQQWQRWLLLAGPVTLMLLGWFLWPGHWERFAVFSQAQEGGLSFWDGESWLYYPRSLLTQYSAGLPVALLLLAGLLNSLWHWRAFRTRSLLTYVLVSWLMLIAVPQKAPRFLYTVAPAALVLAGAWAGQVANWAGRQPRSRQVGLAIAAAIWLLWAGTAVQQRFRFFGQALAAGYASTPETREIYRFVQQATLEQNRRVYLLNSWHLFSTTGLLWSYYEAVPDSPLAYDDGFISAGLVPEPTPANQAALIAQLRAHGIDTILSIDGSPAGDYSGWSIIEPLQAQGQVVHVASSPIYTVPASSFAYQEALLSGEFADPATAVTSAVDYRGSLTLQLHLYRIP
jgi:hypothetical protein